MREAIVNVFEFEFRRGLTWSRLGLWGILTLFPSVLVTLMQLGPNADNSDLAVTVLYYLTQVTCMLTLLIGITSAVQSELEGNSWQYLAVRPNGRRAMLVGKYLHAVMWTCIIVTLSLLPAILILRPMNLSQTFLILLTLGWLTAFSYGTLYALMAVILPQRAMILALAYTIVIEFVIGFIPAVINQFTFQFRLRAVLVDWMGWAEVPGMFSAFTATELHFAVHLLLMFVMMAVLTKIAFVVLDRRQFVASDDG
jgi:ABC-type transport system involved in multi-copper enzyme maturation permease subunit